MPIRTFSRDVFPLIVWMGVIYTLSTGAGGATHTNSGLDTLLAKYFPSLARLLTSSERDAIHYYVRKAAHIMEYLVLGILTVRALRHVFRAPSRALWGAAWVFATIYAATDEFHQVFVPGRTPKVTDVMLNSAGAAIGVGVTVLARKQRTAQISSKS